MKTKLGCILFGHKYIHKKDKDVYPLDYCKCCGLSKEEVGIFPKVEIHKTNCK
jgi:hypothetical protein